MECEKEKGQKVFPIFYHVEPSEVRNQTGIYGEAFKNHQTNADEEKKKKIEEWKSALRKAGQLSGFPIRDGSESKFIEEITSEIGKLIPKLVHVGENIVGIDEKLEQVKLLIDGKSNEVSMVGIYGTGGIGKTTLAKAIYNDMLDQFKRHSFLENVRENTKDDRGLLQLQEKLLCDILMEKNLKLRNVDEGVKMIKTKSQLEKVLLVLDDVDCPRKLKFLAGSSEWFCQGSIIIVTTRYKRCLDVHKAYSSYEAKVLAPNKALELFSLHAFQQQHPRDNYMDLCKRVLHYANGLPLALELLGSCLFQRDEDEWESTLCRLKSIPLEGIQKSLLISYDGLDNKCKKLFLHIACFFKDCKEKIITRILEGFEFHPKIELKVLDERCLISISHGVIRMHDLLQEMGWAIVRDERPGNPGNWSRLWEYKDIKSVLTKNLGTKDIEGIFLNETIVEYIQLPAEAFKNMSQLRLLKFGSNTVQLSQDFELPCRQLTYLDWNGYSLESMPSNFQADNLVELHLQSSSISYLWEGNVEVGMLKILNLSFSKQLVDISGISSAPNLEFLILEGCIRLKSLPTNLHKFKCLQTLSCAGCCEIKSFPEIEENMGKLRELDFSGTGITEVPSSIRHLHGLEYLDLSCCQSLLSLPDSICSLNSLKTLQVNNCPIKSFPEMGENMGRLEKLNLSGTSIIEVPSSIWHLQGLEYLDLSYCQNLFSLPDSICSLNSLITLRVNDCPIKSFPEMRENMGRLEHLNLSGTSIIEVPSSIWHLQGLGFLDLSYCQNLFSLPDSICSLNSLRTLWVNKCPIKSFPEMGENMGRLRGLYLSGTDITEIPSSIWHLQGLEYLDLSYCQNLFSLPDSICSLNSLKTLKVNNCPIKSFPEMGENMGRLDELNLSGTSIIEVPSSIWHLQRLKYLYLSSCQNLLSLPASMCSLISLKTIKVEDCPKLKQIFMKLKVCSSSLNSLYFTCRIVKPGVILENNGFFSLKTLNPRCDQREEESFIHTYPLSSLVQLCIAKGRRESLGGIGNDSFHPCSLKISCVRHYHGMEGRIPSDIFHQSTLEHLFLCNFNFKEAGIPFDNWYLPSLKSLTLRYCNLMEGEVLKHVFCHLSSLRVLDLKGSHFSSIPASITRLSNLRVLNLNRCENLQQIPVLPLSLRISDARGSNSISLRSSVLQFHSLINWFKSMLNQDSWNSVGDFSFENPRTIIALPRSSGILEGISYQSTMSDEVTVKLPPNWYENNDLLGFALYCVYGESQIAYHWKCGCYFRIEGNDKKESLGSFSFDPSCLDYDISDSDISDTAWMLCYPKVAPKEYYWSNQWTHFTASFSGGGRVEGCGIHLLYAKDYGQMHPSTAQASSSHGNFGDHGSPTKDDYNKRSPTEQGPGGESHHKRFRGTQH